MADISHYQGPRRRTMLIYLHGLCIKRHRDALVDPACESCGDENALERLTQRVNEWSSGILLELNRVIKERSGVSADCPRESDAMALFYNDAGMAQALLRVLDKVRVSTINDVPFSTVSDGRRVMSVGAGIIGAGIKGWNAMNHSPPRGREGSAYIPDSAFDRIARVALCIPPTALRGTNKQPLINGVDGDSRFERTADPTPFTSRFGAIDASPGGSTRACSIRTIVVIGGLQSRGGIPRQHRRIVGIDDVDPNALALPVLHSGKASEVLSRHRPRVRTCARNQPPLGTVALVLIEVDGNP